MTITPNPTDARLKFVWDKQKPQVAPQVMMDVIVAVAERVAPRVPSPSFVTWADRVEDAGRKADPRFAEAFNRWRHSDDELVDVSFMDAVVALVTEMPEFKKASPVDALIPWFAKEMNRLFLLSKDVNAPEYPAYYEAKYARVKQALGEDPIVVEWFEKKKPNLSKLDAEGLLDEVEAFEQDRVPEVVYKFKDGSKVVKLATRTQIQKEGEALKNCLKKGSSYTENYCRLAESGKSAFYSLRDPYGDSVLSIQWSPGQESPEQVYGLDNREPDDGEAAKVEEWVTSRDGVYKSPKRFGRLNGSALIIAEYIDSKNEGYEDGDIEHYAALWDEHFSMDDAKAWIDLFGGHGYDAAKAVSGEGVGPEEFQRLPESVRTYLWEGNTSDAGKVILMGLLASMMKATARGPRPGPRVPEGQERLPFGESFFERKPEPEPKPVKFPRHFEADDKEKRRLAEAQSWIDAGWNDKDDFDEAVLWWSNWFSPDDAFFFAKDLADYDKENTNRYSSGMPIEVAVELRDVGIDAWDVADATHHSSTVIDIRNIDSIVKAVEESREWLRANKRRRRTSRRTRPR
jgi:hypothetical protein